MKATKGVAAAILALLLAGCDALVPANTEQAQASEPRVIVAATTTAIEVAPTSWELRTANRWWPVGWAAPAYVSEFNIWERANGTALVRVFSGRNLAGATVTAGDVTVTLHRRRAGLYVANITASQLKAMLVIPPAPAAPDASARPQVSVAVERMEQEDDGRIYYRVTATIDKHPAEGEEFWVVSTPTDSWYTGYMLPTYVYFSWGTGLSTTYHERLEPCCLDAHNWNRTGARDISLSFSLEYDTEYPVAELADTVVPYSDTVSLPELRLAFGVTDRWIDEGTELTFQAVGGAQVRIQDSWRTWLDDIVTMDDAGNGTYTVRTCCEGSGWTRYRRYNLRKITAQLETSAIQHRYHIYQDISRRYYVSW